LKKLQDHPTVIRLLEAILTDRDEFYMVFEYQPMSLIEHYKYAKNCFGIGLSEAQIKSFVFQIALALDSLHKAQIMHRDIKPENVMVEGNAVKLIDFGLAKKNEFSKNTEYVSTRWYRAPEVLLEEPYSFSADIFSLGCVMLELYHSEEVFKGSSSIDQLFKFHEFI
jgi:protein kinase